MQTLRKSATVCRHFPGKSIKISNILYTCRTDLCKKKLANSMELPGCIVDLLFQETEQFVRNLHSTSFGFRFGFKGGNCLTTYCSMAWINSRKIWMGTRTHTYIHTQLIDERSLLFRARATKTRSSHMCTKVFHTFRLPNEWARSTTLVWSTKSRTRDLICR